MMILDIWNSYIYDEVRNEIKRSSQLRTPLKRVVENRRFEIYSLPSIFLELILITKLRAAFKPRLQSFI